MKLFISLTGRGNAYRIHKSNGESGFLWFSFEKCVRQFPYDVHHKANMIGGISK